MANESPQVRLPGRIYRKRTRWWWKVQLPGEKSPRSRALKPQGARQATTDRRLAGEIALTMWQETLQAETRARVVAEHAMRIRRLRARLRAKMKTVRDAITRAEAKAEAAVAAKAVLEAELSQIRRQMRQAAPCGCCGRPVAECDLRRIDSGQRICRSCLDELHRAAQRQSAGESNAEDGWQDTKDGRQRHPLSSNFCHSSEDPLDRRYIHDSYVLYPQASSR